MSDLFHSRLRKQFGSSVPFPPEYIEIPAEIEPVITDFFSALSALNPDLRVQHIWIDDGKLRIVCSGSQAGLDAIISAAEDAAANIIGGFHD